MTTQEAKAVLVLYRPETADAEDPTFSEALRVCEQDAELRRWFEDHCGVYQTLRMKLKQVPIPEGFKEQILAERKVNRPAFWRVPVTRAVAATFAVLTTIGFLVFQLLPHQEDTGFSGFRERMIGKALRGYAMDLATEDHERVRAYLQERGAISDYILPKPLESAQLAGCLATTWQGKPVSMICFRSNNPLHTRKSSDLWLFVTDNTAVPGAPAESKPALATVNAVTTASWTQNGKTYLLAIEGDETWLRNYL